MTELEKAAWEFLFNEPSLSLLKHRSPYPDLVDAVTSDREKAFKAGAEWQKQKMIDKACEWLVMQEEMIGVSFQEDFIERFKKAMEE